MKNIFLYCLVLALQISFIIFPQAVSDTGSEKRLEQHVSVLAADSLEGRGLGTAGKEIAKQYIADKFRSFGLEPYNSGDYFQKFDLRVSLVRIPITNVVGVLRGSDPALQNEYIVIGAHYDHLGYTYKNETNALPGIAADNDITGSGTEKIIYHGADDNASGVSVLIELAGYFSVNRHLLKRSIIFAAFDAEETGIWGSKKFIDNCKFSVNSIKAMFSFDMLGMYTTNNGLVLKGMGSLDGGRQLAIKLSSVSGITLTDVSADIEARTDTWPFGEKGIPAIHAFTGEYSPYHKPEDTYEKLDYVGMAKIKDYLQTLISGISSMPELLPSATFAARKSPYALQFDFGTKIGLGSSNNEFPNDYFAAKSIFSYNAGFYIQMQLGRRFAFQPAVLFISDGSKSPEGIFRRYSATVPVNFHYNVVNEIGGLVKVFSIAGGYYQYSFGGKNGGAAIDFDSKYNKEEFGLNFGLGFEVMGIQAEYIWQRSLTKLQRAAGVEIYPAKWFFTFGYKLF